MFVVRKDLDYMYVKKGKRINRTGLYLVMTVVLLFCGTLALHSFSLKANCRELEGKKQELEAKKAELNKEKEFIKEQQAYRKTDEYVEYLAREKFGLVYDDEIIFKAK